VLHDLWRLAVAGVRARTVMRWRVRAANCASGGGAVRCPRLRLHSRLVVVSTLLLIAGGAAAFVLIESVALPVGGAAGGGGGAAPVNPATMAGGPMPQRVRTRCSCR